MDETTDDPAVHSDGFGHVTEPASTLIDTRFASDFDGIVHIVAVDIDRTWCGRHISRYWYVEASPPLVCGRCVIAWMQ